MPVQHKIGIGSPPGGRGGDAPPPPAHHVGFSHGGFGFSAPPTPEKDESEVRWLISYSDFMMQLVCLFILLYSVSNIDLKKAGLVASHYRATRGLQPALVGEIPPAAEQLALSEAALVAARLGKAELPSALRVQESPAGWSAELREPAFAPGSAVLLEAARAPLDRVAELLRARVGVVTVAAFGGGAPEDTLNGDALLLAHARAEAVVAHLSRAGFAAAIDPRRLAAAGRTSRDPEESRRLLVMLRTRTHER